MEREVEGFFMWLQRNRVKRQHLTSVIVTLLQVSLQACAEQNHKVRAGAVLLLARTMLPSILRPRKEVPWIDSPHIFFALLISPLPGQFPTFRTNRLAIPFVYFEMIIM
jgi:hypothetical protein